MKKTNIETIFELAIEIDDVLDWNNLQYPPDFDANILNHPTTCHIDFGVETDLNINGDEVDSWWDEHSFENSDIAIESWRRHIHLHIDLRRGWKAGLMHYWAEQLYLEVRAYHKACINNNTYGDAIEEEIQRLADEYGRDYADAKADEARDSKLFE